MIEQLRQRLQALQQPAGIAADPGSLPLGIAAIDAALGGGLARGALHEIAAPGEAHLAAAAGFALGLVSSPAARLLWIAEDMALAESGAPYGPGLMAFGAGARAAADGVRRAHPRSLVGDGGGAALPRLAAVIGELRHGAIDMVAVRRLSLAAAESGALALLLRASPGDDASTAATRWIVGAASERTRFAVELTRNRRGPLGAWILQWSDSDERFLLATHAQPVAAPAVDRPHRRHA